MYDALVGLFKRGDCVAQGLSVEIRGCRQQCWEQIGERRDENGVERQASALCGGTFAHVYCICLQVSKLGCTSSLQVERRSRLAASSSCRLARSSSRRNAITTRLSTALNSFFLSFSFARSVVWVDVLYLVQCVLLLIIQVGEMPVFVPLYTRHSSSRLYLPSFPPSYPCPPSSRPPLSSPVHRLHQHLHVYSQACC